MKRASYCSVLLLTVVVVMLAASAATAEIPWSSTDLGWISYSFAQGWVMEMGSGVSPPVWTGDYDLKVYNVANPQWHKILWLEIRWADGITRELGPTITDPGSGVTLLQYTEGYWTSGKRDSMWKWQIVPQPDHEVIHFAIPFTFEGITRIDVATKCIPEPASVVALLSGLGSLLIVRRRRA